MKKTAIILSLVIICLLCMVALGDSNRNVPLKSPIKGPEGAIAFKITLPDGFNPNTDRCPMVILMHGIFANKGINPMPALAKALAKAGIASIRFDFDGHGQSQGRMQDMTIEKELADAQAVWKYVRNLKYVDGIGLLGHSQGGVIASMTAGRLSANGDSPDGVVLIAPGSVIKEACQNGKFFNATFNPADPPEYIRCWGFMKLGREYLLTTQQLDIYGTASAFKGPVLLLHGSRDGIVPLWCSEKFLETYGTSAQLQVIKGENHTISRHRKIVVTRTVEFFQKVFSL
ncbi:MAG: alpha/beta fold hydrolase [Bacteroidales bacterium]|nr:alpha/beta fold hydrolase [Bacteroidales bacterium]MBO7646595.1 alpha/beta fold hydrolase [Bacteroidales bacterium]